MTVFKTTLQIVKKYKFSIILYTVLLIAFTCLNFQSNETGVDFTTQKPDISIVNHDTNQGITKDFIDYLSKTCNIKEMEDEEALSDALFYRDISYIVEIPKGFREDILDGKKPMIQIQSTGDYDASLSELIVQKYMRIISIYQKETSDESKMIQYTNEALKEITSTQITSKLDTTNLQKLAFYYNFLNYSVLAGCVYVLCLILASFKEKNVYKRTLISSMNYKTFNNQLMASVSLVGLMMWVIYVIISRILIGDIVFTTHGLWMILNSFVFVLCALSLAFLLGVLITNKNSINAIINVVALGSSFLCGAFVPVEFMPEGLLKAVQVLPSYWYIHTNEMIKGIEVFTMEEIKPLLMNMLILLLFAIIFMIITQVVSKKKQKIA